MLLLAVLYLRKRQEIWKELGLDTKQSYIYGDIGIGRLQKVFTV